MKRVLLSHYIKDTTPLYGGKYPTIVQTASIKNGDSVNETNISTTVHCGTHIDLPYHFYKNGQTIKDYNIDFWFFNTILFVELLPDNMIISDELTRLLDNIEDIGYDILIVKTGMGKYRNEEKYWKEGYGFSPKIHTYLRKKFPNIRVIGFDLISVTSYLDRPLGKEAHKCFLNPDSPILLLEDMNLTDLSKEVVPSSVIVSPLFIDNCDGLPCSVYGII